MARTTITKKCPHCGSAYMRGESTAKWNRVQYGSPIVQCNRCKQFFKDDDFREIAVDGIRKLDKMVVSPAGVVYGLLGLLIGISAIIGTGSAFGALIIIGGLITPIMEIATYKRRMEDLEKETIASGERLKVPEYAVVLDKMGYRVPKEFLPDAYLKEKEEKEKQPIKFECTSCGKKLAGWQKTCPDCGKIDTIQKISIKKE